MEHLSPIMRAIQQFAREHGIDCVDLLMNRSRHMTQLRQEAYHWVYSSLFPNFSLDAIGRRFGTDHSTVLHGIHRYCERTGTPLPPFAQRRYNRTPPVGPVSPPAI